jgi:predicted AlkP superfamily pyrophosphatase or phosphodiesterase
MSVRIGVTLSCAAGAFALLMPGVRASQTPASAVVGQSQTPGAGPSLVVLIVADQFRADYVDMYGMHWTGGLRELFTKGASFTQAAYEFGITKTCAGHATIATGTNPSTHGMIENEWFDPTTRTFTTCTEDPASRSLVYGGKTGEEFHSARWLRVPTFADELVRQSGGRSRVASMSIKPRSAITLGGRGGDTSTIVWSEDTGGVWATSSALTRRLSPDVDAYVRANPVKVEQFQTWNRFGPPNIYQFADQAPGEPAGAAGVFPHVYEEPIRTSRTTPALINSWESTPFTDVFLAGLAKHLLDRQKLGQERRTDLLAVSFSSLDTIGHRFGPRSHEVQDTLLRLDQVLGDLLRTLDERVGRNRYVLAFSSDHGVGILPEQAFPSAGRGRGAAASTATPAGAAGRASDGAAPLAGDEASESRTTAGRAGNPGGVSSSTGTPGSIPAAAAARLGGAPGGGAQQAGRASATAIGTAVESLLDKQFGRGSYVEALFGSYFYFRSGVLDRIRKDPALVKAVESAALGVRGVARVYWASDLAAATPTSDPILAAMRKSYVAGRSGDLMYVLQPGWVTSSDATHGSPYEYDRRVPVIFYGAGIAPGQYTSAASPADIAPTLSAVTGVRLPKVDGRVLQDALAKK